MGASDELQIFVDMEHEEIEVAESLLTLFIRFVYLIQRT